jgi:hypothetical protein
MNDETALPLIQTLSNNEANIGAVLIGNRCDTATIPDGESKAYM